MVGHKHKTQNILRCVVRALFVFVLAENTEHEPISLGLVLIPMWAKSRWPEFASTSSYRM